MRRKTVFLITDKSKFGIFYNQAIAKLVSSYALRYKHDELQQQIRVGNSIYDIDFRVLPAAETTKNSAIDVNL